MDTDSTQQLFDRRRAGLLLHPTSLPRARIEGCLGTESCRFIDFLVNAGFTVWQMLPQAPTHGDRSPYNCLSVHAGNPAWICLSRLRDAGWLSGQIDAERRQVMLRQARLGFLDQAGDADREAFDVFSENNRHWLDDYALFVVLREKHELRGWFDWPPPLRDRHPEALAEARATLRDSIAQVYFEQFAFFRQWMDVKEYANKNGVRLFGDIPIYVAHDSADVWANRQYFDVEDDGRLRSVAGVPPDYFSETGQRWGNPHYDWNAMERDRFGWWRDRFAASFNLFDLVRVDHFRGFEAYWSIPADQETAVNGHWCEAPGKELFETLYREFASLPIVAEDLGLITPEVIALRKSFGIPGMKVLQFAFDGDADNLYLPHNHERLSVVYTGTQDNDTTVGWFYGLAREQQDRVMAYLGYPAEEMPWPLIRAAYASVANLAVIPLQDILSLGSDHRMNTPGTTQGNWLWQFSWEQLTPELTQRTREMVSRYGR